jgi:hypothetical protein
LLTRCRHRGQGTQIKVATLAVKVLSGSETGNPNAWAKDGRWQETDKCIKKTKRRAQRRVVHVLRNSANRNHVLHVLLIQIRKLISQQQDCKQAPGGPGRI